MTKCVTIDKLYKMYFDELLIYVTGRVYNKDDAFDLLQDVFCEIVRTPKILEFDKQRGYLYRAVKNRIINYRKKHSFRRYKFHEPIDDTEGINLIDETSNPERTTFYRNELDIIERLLKSLSPKRRTIFVLIRYRGYTYKEVAEQLNTTIKTVEHELSNIMKFLIVETGKDV